MTEIILVSLPSKGNSRDDYTLVAASAHPGMVNCIHFPHPARASRPRA